MLEDFYRYLADNNTDAILAMNLPKSDVYYIKALLKEKFNRDFTVEEVRDLLIEEGYGTHV